MSGMTILTLEEAEKSKVLKDYGLNCAPTDFAIFLGCNVSNYHYTSEGINFKDRSCFWFVRTFDALSNLYGIICNNKKDVYSLNIRTGGYRFCLPFNFVDDSSLLCDVKNGIKEVEYGHYPSFIAPFAIQNTLELLYTNKKLKRTGKKYTADCSNIYDYNKPFQIREFFEYEYSKKKYIRFTADKNSDGKVLSDGTIVRCNHSYWISVENVKWLYDEELNLLISKNVLFSGAQISNNKKISSFLDSDIKWIIDNFIYYDITDNKNKEKNSSFDELDKSDYMRLSSILNSLEFINFGKKEIINDFLLKVLINKYFDIDDDNIDDIKRKLICYKDKVNCFIDNVLDIIDEQKSKEMIRKR